MEPIIHSLLETDLYKFSMGQAIYHQFSDYKTTWTFKCRNEEVFFTPEMVEEIRAQIKLYCNLRFTEDELSYLENIKWIKGSFTDFLRLWSPRYEDFTIRTDAPCGLSIETKGTWLNTSFYEIPTLAIVNEVYFRMAYDYDAVFRSFGKHLQDKIAKLSDGTYQLGKYSEFGLRRRLSSEAQELAISSLLNVETAHSTLLGTSNVYLARKFGITPVGTMAHEWIMCTGQGNQKHNPAYSNWYALEAWIKEYGVLNGIALTDTITTDCFLKDFQLTYATLFNGVRHDSGDPYEWGEKIIAHYEKLGINPKQKTLLFSDSLDFDRASKIYEYFHDRIGVAFGIGTYISNDTDYPALNIVMKITSCNGMDVAKLSDTPGKGMCKNEAYVEYLNRCIEWRLGHSKKTSETFDVEEVTEKCCQWIRDWFEQNGKGCNAIIGISGGKDSSVVAALCAKALGKDRVIGVLMPNRIQDDIAFAHLLCDHLQIRNYVIDIGDAVDALKSTLLSRLDVEQLSVQTQINLPPRIRMSTLYAISQTMNGRVINTCNLSEDYVGYSTKYGDAAGDMSPLAHLTVTEVREIGRYLGLPKELVEKAPSDGLSGKTDEDNLGFTYETLDTYIRTGICEDAEIRSKIEQRHRANLFKLLPMEAFPGYR